MLPRAIISLLFLPTALDQRTVKEGQTRWKPCWIQPFKADKFGIGSFSSSYSRIGTKVQNWLELQGEVQSCSQAKAGIYIFWLAKSWRKTLSFQLCYSMAEVLVILHAAGGHPQSHQNMRCHSLFIPHSWHHVYGPACRLGRTSRTSPSQLARISSPFDVSTFCSCSELGQNQMFRFLLWTDSATSFLFVTLAGWLWDDPNRTNPSRC